MKEKVLLIFFLCNVALFVSAQSHMEKDCKVLAVLLLKLLLIF